MQRWAADDTAAFPTPEDITAEATDEFELLCRAWGQWTLVDPDVVFDRPLWWADLEGPAL
ncbi:hypothetical protein N9D66_00365 [Candidatus Nanopelagicales bacterium]|nr:hypothetical protein [Candidatus Nanopelagicales bacterium]